MTINITCEGLVKVAASDETLTAFSYYHSLSLGWFFTVLVLVSSHGIV